MSMFALGQKAGYATVSIDQNHLSKWNHILCKFVHLMLILRAQTRAWIDAQSMKSYKLSRDLQKMFY